MENLNGEVRYTWDKQRGGHCIHDPIHSDTYPRDKAGVVRMKTGSIIYIHFTAFILYYICLTWLADTDISLSDYGRKEINITYIWDAWLRPYRWISPHDHPDDSVDWDSQGPQQWPPLVLVQYFLYLGPHIGWHYAWWIWFYVFLEGWEYLLVLGLYPECLDMDGGWW